MSKQSPQTEKKYNGPTVRLESPDGLVIYPRMVPDGKGDWMISDPEIVKDLLQGDGSAVPDAG